MKIRSQLSKFLVAATALTPVFISQEPVEAQAGVKKPKLVIILVMDQVRAEYLTRYAPFFGEGGFKLLMKRGANLTNAHYSHATTYTGPGHALIGSGSYGHTSGVVGNRFYNRDSKQIESMFYDVNAKLLGLEAVPKDDDTSPRNFLGNNLADQLLLSNNRKSKAVAIANKDRAAIMLAGKLGKAYWYHEGAGGMTTSTFYATDLPPWIKQFNARKIPDSYYGKAWTKLMPETAYSISHADDFAAETDFKGLGRTFPHVLTDKTGKPTADFYEGFTATPWANDYQLELARTAITAEGLGSDEFTDILGVSLTATDIAGHSYGPDSHEVQDIMMRLDGQLAAFLKDINRKFASDEVLIALTADHGASPLPEHMTSLGLEAGRIKRKSLSDAVETALTAKYGAPANGAKWVRVVEDPSLFLDDSIIAEKKLDAAEVERTAGEAMLTVKGIALYYTREQMISGQLPANRWAAMLEKAFYPTRSGEVLFITKPFYFNGTYGDRDTGSTHGTPYEYDTHVPLIIAGTGVRSGTYNDAVDMADLAPTLANLIGIDAPAGSEGRRLGEILR
jgi:predicted AlkP superfamily pyrophosphatase or phosphodiesterase